MPCANPVSNEQRRWYLSLNEQTGKEVLLNRQKDNRLLLMYTINQQHKGDYRL